METIHILLVGSFLTDTRIHLQLLYLGEWGDGRAAPETTQFLLAPCVQILLCISFFYFVHILCLIFPFAAVEAYARKLNEIVPFGSLLLAELFVYSSKWNCLEIISRDCAADLELKEAWLGASFVHFWVSLETEPCVKRNCMAWMASSSLLAFGLRLWLRWLWLCLGCPKQGTNSGSGLLGWISPVLTHSWNNSLERTSWKIFKEVVRSSSLPQG